MVQFIVKPKSEYIDPDKKLSGMCCAIPFRHLEIHPGGDTSICCLTFLPEFTGNILQDGPERILKNVKRLQIQNDMKKSKFSYCNDQCVQLSSYLNGGTNYTDIIPVDQLPSTLASSEFQIYFNYDNSCNLQCPSCRTKLIFYNPTDSNDEQAQQINLVHEKVKQLVEVCSKTYNSVLLSITGSGDVFASITYWNYLLELSTNGIPDNVRLNILTNGVLMTENNWNSIKPLLSSIRQIEVSVDAATEPTYKIVRKNGNFKKLCQNLETLDRLIQQGYFPKLECWTNNFIVQKNNYEELIDFVKWQLSFKSKPHIATTLIAQWAHISNEKFAKMAIWQEGNPDREKLRAILQNPIFKHPQVNLGNLSSL